MGKKVNAAGPLTDRGIFIATDDRVLLEALLRRAVDHPLQQAGSLAALAEELRRARVVPRTELPPDVVSMGSTVRIRDLETGEDETYTLVYPDESDIEDEKLSVLSPVGTALLGYRSGDEIEWPVPAGVRRFRVEEVMLQPERMR
ncbi:nucleoside diphosphate kinase regulator [Limnoglobus roseus]|uniref:Transcription elongation factor GreA n=1 Tax=Limnoglobus roseus TaxID=2598579 RepID=A0A5C1AGZ2_9BACT|nr:nucleoside diphosphate kinase regulator [Limnoglobus roseus]QEL17513.1 transcription elongation factor GreA [Limnoglobus roseus]